MCSASLDAKFAPDDRHGGRQGLAPAKAPAPLRETSGRHDLFLFWGNGRACWHEMLGMIRDHGGFEILRCRRYKPLNMGWFIRRVYGTDRVPLEHLETKTRYLMDVEPEVLAVLVRNRQPRPAMTGEGVHRHQHCGAMTELKGAIRERFNPRFNGDRTQEHVIHGTDDPDQTEALLRLMGQQDGTAGAVGAGNQVLGTPGHVGRFDRFQLRLVEGAKLHARLLAGPASARPLESRIIELRQTPHVDYVRGRKLPYEIYWRTYAFGGLENDHSPQAYDRLIEGFDYLRHPHERGYIVVRKMAGVDGWLIVDGLHRAAILEAGGWAGGDEGRNRWLVAEIL